MTCVWWLGRRLPGLALLIGRNLAVAACGQDEVTVRVDPAESSTLTCATGPEVAVMHGPPMPGRLRIAAAEVPIGRRFAE